MRPNFSPIFVVLPGIWRSGTTDSRLRMRNLSGWFTRPSGTVRLSGGPDAPRHSGCTLNFTVSEDEFRVATRTFCLRALSLLTPPDEPYTGQCRNADVLLA